MQFFRPALILLIFASLGYTKTAPEIIQIQRDMAQIQDQMRQLQKSMDERMSALTTLLQQAVETSSKTGSSVSALESGLRDRLSQQLTAPISGVSTKVDQMSAEFQGVRENVSAMNETLTKITAQIVDLNNAVKVLQTPAAPPPSALGVSGPAVGGGAPSNVSAPPPGVSMRQLYDSAMGDRSGGNLDLAMQGFQEFLKWYGQTELAPNAQFYVGQIYYDKNDYGNSIRAFDAVLERYADNNKSADAMYMKGMALLKSGQRTQAAQEFLSVIQKYPNSEVANKAKAQRRALGLSVPAAGRPAAASRRR